MLASPPTSPARTGAHRAAILPLAGALVGLAASAWAADPPPEVAPSSPAAVAAPPPAPPALQVAAPPSGAEPWHIARAPEPPSRAGGRAPPVAAGPDDGASLDQVRGDVGGWYFRGTRMLGRGTRSPYQGGAGTGRLEARWFPWRYVGFEVNLWAGVGHLNAASNVGLQAAIDVAPLRWSGPWGGGIMLHAGGGVEFGDRSWLQEEVRGYPLLGARFVLWPAPRWSLRGGWEIAPIATNALRVRLQRAELAAGYRWGQVGVRASFSDATGGDPVRTYSEMRFGAFFGASWY